VRAASSPAIAPSTWAPTPSLFTLLAAAHGATVLAVEAQSGFIPEIEHYR
jgi:hypothetical protein